MIKYKKYINEINLNCYNQHWKNKMQILSNT